MSGNQINSTGLAPSLAKQGHTVGILDIDITGPNVPKMMGLDGKRLHVEQGRIHPAQGHQSESNLNGIFARR